MDDPLYYCILPLFFLHIMTTRHLLIVPLYRHRPHRPWGAGGGSEDPGSVQGIQKQEQPEPTLSLPRLHPCQRKTALPWNNLGQSSQQSPNTPKKNLQIVPLCRWLYCDLFYITLPCSFKYILPLFDHNIKDIIVASSIRVEVRFVNAVTAGGSVKFLPAL